MKIIIRNFKPDDITSITAIQKQAVLEGFGSFALTPMNETEILMKFQGLVKDHYPCLVSTIEDKIVGFANASPHRPRPGYRWTVEDSVYVNPENQGKGVGYSLLSELIRQCETLGFRQMIAVIGDSDNTGSIGIHKKCGFGKAGVFKSVGYKNGKWLDAVLMQRALGQSDTTNPSTEDYPGTLFNT